MGIGDFLRRVRDTLFPRNSLEKRLHVHLATSATMENAIDLWRLMYQGTPPWKGGPEHVKTLNLPAAIAEEFSRLVLTEFSVEVSGSPRADYINGQMDNLRGDLSNIVEMWAAMGGVVLKPYVIATAGDELDEIAVDVVQANRFYPTEFNSNREITGAVFVESKRMGDFLFTRLEYHRLAGTEYTVTNRAFRSERLMNAATTEDDNLTVKYPFQDEISLDSVEGWQGIEPEITLYDIEKPLFTYIKVPKANTVDSHSPLGMSIFGRSVTTIEEADKQFSRILWEYEATEAAVEADSSLFKNDKKGNPVLPRGKERLYRTFDFEGSNAQGFLQEYAPAIRDTSLFNGLNELCRKIEFQCGLAYGTISDPSEVTKTAEEIRASKQRSYHTVSQMQAAWDKAFDDLIYIMDAYCSLYGIQPPGVVEKACTWGDGVLEDTDKEYQRRWSMVVAGKYKLEKFYAWYFGCTEEEALDLIPAQGPAYPPLE